MNFLSAFSWWQWLIIGVVPPLIVMLYFLKLKRSPIQVPSTYLWKRTIEDLHVNSIWQRLRQNLLLYLQLLFIGLLILAALRPGMAGREAIDSRTILLIDHSASMQATDVGPTRLAEAKRLAKELIDNMQDSDVAMVIGFSDRADVKQGFTSDRNRLRAAVDAITPSNRTTDVREALRAAAGLANPGRISEADNVKDVQVAEAMPATLFLLSDGGFIETKDFDLGNLAAKYIPIGDPAVDNVGIIAFNVDRNADREDEVEAYAQLANFGTAAVELTASLELNGTLLDASSVKIEPGEEAGVNFQFKGIEEGTLKLSLDRADKLELDNVAYAALAPPRPLEVLVIADNNTALETALKTKQCEKLARVEFLPTSVLDSESFKKETKSTKYDLMIFHDCSPKEMPACNTLFLGSIPPGDQWKAGETVGPVFLLDADRIHPLLQYVELNSIRIVEGHSLTLPEGAKRLIVADCGPIFGVASRDAFQDAVLGFSLTRKEEGTDVANTDWPIKRSFPVFVLNCLEFLGGATTTSSARSVQPGVPITISAGQRYDRLKIVDPDQKAAVLDRATVSQIIYTATDKPGIYRVQPETGDNSVEMFAVNLFSAKESKLNATQEIELGAEKVAGQGGQQAARHEYWKWLLLLALGALMYEWTVYNRRIRA